MKHTSNLKLKKPDYSDKPDIKDINDNMEIIDKAVIGKEPKITKKSGFNLNKSDSVSSTSTSTLATSKAVKTVNDKFVRIDNVRQYKAQISLSTKYSVGEREGSVVFDTLDENNGGFYNASYPTRLTIPNGLGIKRVIVIAKCSTSGSSGTQIVKKNGTKTIYNNSSGKTITTAPINVVGGEYFELQQYSGTSPHNVYSGTFLRIEVVE